MSHVKPKPRSLLVGASIAALLALCIGVVVLLHRKNGQVVALRQTYTRLYYIADKCTEYHKRHNEYPANLAGLREFSSDIRGSLVVDGWGNAISFHRYDSTLNYGSVQSLGRDARIGGRGLDKDWEIRFPTDSQKPWNDAIGRDVPESLLRP